MYSLKEYVGNFVDTIDLENMCLLKKVLRLKFTYSEAWSDGFGIRAPNCDAYETRIIQKICVEQMACISVCFVEFLQR